MPSILRRVIGRTCSTRRRTARTASNDRPSPCRDTPMRGVWSVQAPYRRGKPDRPFVRAHESARGSVQIPLDYASGARLPEFCAVDNTEAQAISLTARAGARPVSQARTPMRSTDDTLNVCVTGTIGELIVLVPRGCHNRLAARDR